jgi:DNA-directed RNA polymerase specialized sigma24 family protein
VIGEPIRRLDEDALRVLVPRVLASLVRRGEEFDAAEDALQEALLEALHAEPRTGEPSPEEGDDTSSSSSAAVTPTSRPPPRSR